VAGRNTRPLVRKARRAVLAAAPACATAALLASPAGAGATARPHDPVAHSSVIRGVPADPARWSFAVAILERGRLECSGSLISPTTVLTAAHCALKPNGDALDPTGLSVVVGRASVSGAGGEVIPVIASRVTQDYPASRRHDAAVFTLAFPATAGTPVQLATAAEDAEATLPGAALEVAGFGSRNPLLFGRPKGGLLRTTTEYVRTNCKRAYGPDFEPVSMICALGLPVPRLIINHTICSGDSGGPLVALTPEGPRQVGIVSFSGAPKRGRLRFINCGLPRYPAVYTRVSDVISFIAG
jgi:secreted trypsin-like serine protease